MYYDYKEGKKKIEEILNNNTGIQNKEVPKDDSNFTYDNGIRIWIGKVVIDACVLADKAGKNVNAIIGVSNLTYDNFIEKLTENNLNALTWFTKKYDYDLNKYSYYGNIINTEFDEWINENF